MRLAILSDTHGLLRREVLEQVQGVQAILHAGDIGGAEVLTALRAVAPVYAVQGNADGGWGASLPTLLEGELSGLRFCITHKKQDLPKDLRPCHLAVTGHSHRWSRTQAGETLVLNPGSCGPRRFHQPITLALGTWAQGRLTVERVDIPHPGAGPAPTDLYGQVNVVLKETAKGRTPRQIADRYGMDPALTEQIARLIVTHPGVTAEGILRKLGL